VAKRRIISRVGEKKKKKKKKYKECAEARMEWGREPKTLYRHRSNVVGLKEEEYLVGGRKGGAGHSPQENMARGLMGSWEDQVVIAGAKPCGTDRACNQEEVESESHRSGALWEIHKCWQETP